MNVIYHPVSSYNFGEKRGFQRFLRGNCNEELFIRDDVNNRE